MASHAQPRRVVFFTESTFATPPADWTSGPVQAWCVDPDVTGVGQESLANENYRLGVLRGHAPVSGRKVSEAAFSQYMTARGTNAAEDAQATTTQLAENLRCAMGGRALGTASGCVSATGAVLTVDTGHGAHYEQGDFMFLVDATDGVGQFYRVESVTGDAVTLDREPHFTVVADDTAHAVIHLYLHERHLTDHADSDHITRSLFFRGEDTDDRYQLEGCKLAATISGLAAGEMPRVEFAVSVTDFEIEDAPNPTLTGNPEGEAPLVVGRDRSYVFLADDGAALASAGCVFTCEPSIGITWERVPSIGGVEGTCGYIATGFDDVGVALSLPYDSAHNEDYRDGIERHLLVQIGTSPLRAVGLYFPRLVHRAEPTRGDATGVTTSDCDFRALYDDASPGALTGDALEKWRSPIHVLLVA